MSTFHQILNQYHQRSLREKFLLFGFVLIIFAIWTQSFMERSNQWNDQRQVANVELTTQQQWLDREEQYANQLTKALEKVEPSKTFTAAQLSGKVDELIRKINLESKADLDPVQTKNGEIFNDHTMRLRVNDISISEFIQLNTVLKENTPYIEPKSIRISKNQRKPEEMDVRFEINSFDLIEKNI
jgi:hypothetical protein